MKVQCGHCPAKYAVADERVRDKKVRIRCRRCNAAIVVDGKVSPPLVTSTPARPSAGPGSHAPGPESLPPSTPPPDHPRPVAHTIMGGLEAPVTHQLMQAHVGGVAPVLGDDYGFDEARAGKPDSSRGLTDPPARGEADRWRVALTQQDLRWMTTEEITQAFKDGAVKSETFVFRAGMPSWVTLLEVSEIARALADARLVSPPLQTLRLDEELAEPQRSSSLPPPRKAVRRSPSPLAELLAATADGAAEPEESMPFALVAERVGSKRPDATPAREPEEREDAPESSADATVNGAAPAPVEEPAPAPPPAAPTATAGLPGPVVDTGGAPVGAPAQKSSGAWIWISVAVLLVLAGAAILIGPRFGLQLR